MATALTAMSATPKSTQSTILAPHAPQTVNAKLVPAKNLEHNATLKTSRADETLYTVKCYWDKAPEQWQPNEAAVYNNDFYESGIFEPYDDEGNELDINYIEVKVPAGTYDIMTSFYGLKYNELFQANVPDFNAYVIKQNVTVSGDMELKFDPATATNAYTFEPKTPEGELFCPSEYYVTEDWQLTLKKQGNITGGLSFDFLMLYKGQTIVSHDSSYSCITYTDDSPVGAYNPFRECVFKVSDVSDDYTFIGLTKTFSEGENGRLLYALGALKPNGNKAFTNDPSTYRNTDVKFKYSPLGAKTKEIADKIREEDPYSGETFYIFSNIAINGELSWMAHGWGGSSESFLHISASNDALSTKIANIAHQTNINEYWETGENEASYSQNEVTNLNIFDGDNTSLAIFGLGWLNSPSEILPGNTVYNATMGNLDDIFYGTSPAAVSYYINTKWGDDMMYSIGLNFCGRLGESRGVDDAVTSYKFYQDGAQVETVTNSNSLWEWMDENGANLGKTRLTWENPNMEVEGIRAGNSGELCFDAKSDKPWPASLTMLQFRDENNRISSVFPSGEKATIGLSAAGLECYPTEYNLAFTPTKPALVKVEIAPTGTDNFTELTLEEHPDAFYTIGFGSYYTSSLATATAEGWYDVRIRVEESADNYQLQTITRAFKIGERAGIDAPAIDEVADAPAVYYNLMGARVANPERGQILIRVQGTKATKVIF